MRKYRFGLGVFVLALAVVPLTLAPSGIATPPFCPALEAPSTGHPACRRISVDGDHFQVPLVVGSSGMLVLLEGHTSPDISVVLFRDGQFWGGIWPAGGSAFGVAPGTWTVQLRRTTTATPTGDVVDTMEVRVRPAA